MIVECDVRTTLQIIMIQTRKDYAQKASGAWLTYWSGNFFVTFIGAGRPHVISITK